MDTRESTYTDNGYEAAAMNAFERQDYALAKEILMKALKAAKISRRIEPWLINLTHALATAYCLDRRYDEAEYLYTTLLAVEEKILGSSHPDVIGTLKKLAVIVRENQGNSLKAKTIAFRVQSLAMRANAV